MNSFAPPLEFLAALQSGDADAWRTLFETYGEPLYLYAYHRLDGNTGLAEDVRQETFLSAIQSIDRYRGEAPLFGWLCGIARYKTLDLIRRDGREVPLEGSQSEPGQIEMEPREPADWGQLMDPELLPEDYVVTGEQRAAVIEALWSLPEDYRQALIWRYVRGTPVDQVASRLQKTYKSSESLLSRARAALRDRLIQTVKSEYPDCMVERRKRQYG